LHPGKILLFHHRRWNEFKTGFGNFSTEFWIGDSIHYVRMFDGIPLFSYAQTYACEYLNFRSKNLILSRLKKTQLPRIHRLRIFSWNVFRRKTFAVGKNRRK